MIFATIRKIISTAFKAVYAIISFLYLQYTLLVLLVGLVLLITGVFKANQSIYVIFWVILGLSIVLALYLNLKRLAPKSNKKKKRGYRPPKQVEIPKPTYIEQPSDYTPPIQPQPVEEKPIRYLRVRQNPNYAVGEFSDRYELYLITKNGLKKIRVDYK